MTERQVDPSPTDARALEAPRDGGDPHGFLTPRLALRLGTRADVGALLAFYARNRGHFARWDPPRAPDFETAPFWDARVDRLAREADEGESLRLFAFAREADENTVVAFVSLTRFERATTGEVQAQLGYGVDAAYEGRGVMTEALHGALGHLVKMGVRRLVATYDVDNLRSARLLERLGFVRERVLPRHLESSGALRDHVLVTKRIG